MMDVMLDLETLGTKPGCIVLSVGAVAFDRNTGAELREFYRVIKVSSCADAGLKAEPDTAVWWARQPDEARAIFARDVQDHAAPAIEAAMDFSEWVANIGGIGTLWAQGADFDPPIWRAAMEACGLDAPWPFWAVRDTRTAYEICGFDPHSVERNGIHHNALDDARHQVRCLVAALDSRRTAE